MTRTSGVQVDYYLLAGMFPCEVKPKVSLAAQQLKFSTVQFAPLTVHDTHADHGCRSGGHRADRWTEGQLLAVGQTSRVLRLFVLSRFLITEGLV